MISEALARRLCRTMAPRFHPTFSEKNFPSRRAGHEQDGAEPTSQGGGDGQSPTETQNRGQLLRVAVVVAVAAKIVTPQS